MPRMRRAKERVKGVLYFANTPELSATYHKTVAKSSFSCSVKVASLGRRVRGNEIVSHR